MAYAAKKSGSRQVVGFFFVVLLHIVAFYALKNGLGKSLIDIIKGPLEASLVTEEKPEAEAPPPPRPQNQVLPPPAEIIPEFDIAAPADSGTTINTKAQPTRPVQTAVTVPPRSNPRRPVTQPDYPPTSKRLGEAGTVVMLLTVDESGKVIDAKIDKSSGYERLDQAAIREALRAWKLLPGTVGGKPVTMQYKFAVTFKITD
jgi:protein TonB